MDFPLPIEVQGVRDPRIPLVDVGKLGIDATTPLFEQLKYPRVDSPIPIATWRDAQLMIAEVQGGQTALDIIAVGPRVLPSQWPPRVAEPGPHVRGQPARLA